MENVTFLNRNGDLTDFSHFIWCKCRFYRVLWSSLARDHSPNTTRLEICLSSEGSYQPGPFGEATFWKREITNLNMFLP
jgi:hypothetical protein